MRILGVDTASERRDRGYAIVDSGAVVWHGTAPPPRDGGPIHVVAGERPWQRQAGQGWARRGGSKQAAPKLTGERLITFCVNNGFQLRDAWPWADADGAPEPLFVLIPVLAWKELVLPGCARMQGDAFCNNVRQAFAPAVDNHNHLDAIGIALAASRLTIPALKKYCPKGFVRR